MAFPKEYEENPSLTEWINLPGLTVVDNADWEGTYTAIFSPEQRPRCSCDYAGIRNGYEDPQTIFHIIGDTEEDISVDIPFESEKSQPQIIPISVRKQRFVCPNCRQNGLPKEIRYKPDILLSGHGITKQLEAYIGQACLNKSPEKVSELIGGVKSKSAVAQIFRNWAESRVSDYRNNLIAPEELGVHTFESCGNKYCMVSDIDDHLIIDVFEYNDFNGMLQLLSCLAMDERTDDVVSEIDIACIYPVRGVFRGKTTVTASTSSLVHEFGKEVVAFMDMYYTGRGKKAVASWLSTPAYRDLPIEPEVYRIIRNGHFKHGETAWMLSRYNALRRIVEKEWSQDAYGEWESNIIQALPKQSTFRSTIQLTKENIDNSFDKENLQDLYNSAEEHAVEIIERNQKCSFELLRYRILLTCKPLMTQVPMDRKRPGSNFQYVYRGISMKELLSTLKDYEE